MSKLLAILLLGLGLIGTYEALAQACGNNGNCNGLSCPYPQSGSCLRATCVCG